MMSELKHIKEEIEETKAKLKRAEEEGDKNIIFMYGNILAKQLERENFLETQPGGFGSLDLEFLLCSSWARTLVWGMRQWLTPSSSKSELYPFSKQD